MRNAALGKCTRRCHLSNVRLIHSNKKRSRRRAPSGPGDYEAELLRLCHGSRRKAEQLIREELVRAPSLTRAGAALALVTRIRHQREPRSSRL
jgi:hypothetical protein